MQKAGFLTTRLIVSFNKPTVPLLLSSQSLLCWLCGLCSACVRLCLSGLGDREEAGDEAVDEGRGVQCGDFGASLLYD